jgi:hypothetical protein
MKLRLEPNVIIPLGVTKKFMGTWDEEQSTDEDSGEPEFNAEIEYPPMNYSGEIYWNEMSYHRLTQTSLCWNYDLYSNGNWSFEEDRKRIKLMTE